MGTCPGRPGGWCDNPKCAALNLCVDGLNPNSLITREIELPDGIALNSMAHPGSEALDDAHDRRIDDLLNANNALLERARKAEAERDTFYAMLLKADQIVGEGGSARPTPDPAATREYGEDDPPLRCGHGISTWAWCNECVEDNKEEGLLQAEDAITAMMRKANVDFPTAVELLADRDGNPVHLTGAERIYVAEIGRLRAALAEKRRGE